VRDRGEVTAGQRLLVIGASGGVGSFTVQIAKAYGAEVTAVASTANLDQARALGADYVVDYTREGLGEGYDVVLDISGRSLAELRRAAGRRGTVVLVGGEFTGRVEGGLGRIVGAKQLAPFLRQRVRTFLASENAADLDVLREMVDDGQVVAPVEATYPLEHTAAALRDQFAGHAKAKRVITVAEAA
jgi:NADPH:quinone reductase-like Zn-dependent oxidoreductase